MKMMFICSFLLIVQLAAFAQSLIVWEPEQRLSFDTYNNVTPRVMAQGDTLHVFWARSLAGEKMYIRSTDAGLTWSIPVNVYSERAGNAGSTYSIIIEGHNIYVLWQTCDTCQGNPNNYWVTFRRSTDAGATFEPYRLFFPGSPGFITGKDSLVVFQYSTQQGGFLNLSSDYGITWHATPMQQRNFQQLRLIDNLLHLVQPALGTLRHEVSYSYSTDFGGTWSPETILSTVDIYPSDETQIDGTNDGRVLVVWNDGKYGTTNGFVGSIILRRSIDTTRSWEPEILLTSIPSAGSPRLAVQGSIIGIVWHNESQPFLGISLCLTTDGGTTWLPSFEVSDSSTQSLEPDIAIDGNMISVVWFKRFPGVPDQIYLRRGHIMTTSVQTSNWILQNIHLGQNYPNPFNAETIISYSLVHRTHVSLIVLDILGRQVRELFNGIQDPGEFHLVFDGSTLSSGIYFMRLATDQRSIVRSMVLIK